MRCRSILIKKHPSPLHQQYRRLHRQPTSIHRFMLHVRDVNPDQLHADANANFSTKQHVPQKPRNPLHPYTLNAPTFNGNVFNRIDLDYAYRFYHHSTSDRNHRQRRWTFRHWNAAMFRWTRFISNAHAKSSISNRQSTCLPVRHTT